MSEKVNEHPDHWTGEDNAEYLTTFGGKRPLSDVVPDAGVELEVPGLRLAMALGSGEGAFTSPDPEMDDGRPRKKARIEQLKPERHTLKNVTVRDVLSGRRKRRDRLVTVSPADTLETALSTLAEHRLHAAPVITTDGKFLGMMTVLDVLAALSDSMELNEEDLHQASPEVIWSEFQDIGGELLKKRVNVIMGQSEDARRYLVTEATPVLQIIREAFYDQRRHWVAVMDYSCKIVDVMSQSDIVRFLADNFPLLEPVNLLRLERAGIISRPPLLVKSNDTAGDAFQLMRDKKVTGLGVIDPETDKLVANISVSDLRGMSKEDFGHLAHSVQDFLQAVPGRLSTLRDNAVTCTASDRLSHVVQQLADEGVHRVHVLDADGKPDGVVTLSDVITALAANVERESSAAVEGA